MALVVETLILPSSETLGWVVLCSSGFAVHVLSVANPQGWAFGSAEGQLQDQKST